MIVLIVLISLLSLGFAAYLLRYVLKQETGTDEMVEIADAIREGANAFMKRQYMTIGAISIVVALVILGAYTIFGNMGMGLKTSFAFIFGAFSSGLAGVIGMWTAVRSNIRAAAAARTKSMNKALTIALRGGAVSGIVIVAMSLLGISILYILYGGAENIKEIPFLIIGYGFGASFVALFAQLGGGIYTKAADVGADLVGKIEAGIPEDDPRNPAVIADLVGDNVGDCAGRGADLFESTAAENIGAMILGVALFPVFGIAGIIFPLVVRALGLIASSIGIMVVKTDGKESPMKALNRGFYVTTVIAALLFYLATTIMLGNVLFFFAGLVGMITSLIIVWITMYYTESSYRPVKHIAESSKSGHALNIISGFAIALESTALPVIVLGAALVVSFMLGEATGIESGGLYGTAIATMGMLATAAYVLAMDTFGPIADNAGGIIEMSNQSKEVGKITAKLDAVGNTTKALTKGYAIGSAALAAFLLFSAYLEDVARLTGIEHMGINIAKVDVFAGGMMGAVLVFLFTALAIRAVGITANSIIAEVRRQFREIKGLMEGKAKPDYAKCVDICTTNALKQMVLPGMVVVLFTIVVGIILKAEAAGAFLMVATIVGIMMALLLNTGGGAWDNAKKHIEDGMHGGKGSDAHKSAVTGDTVGDPFKDTAGPSLHVLIKLLGTLTLVLLPLFV